MKERAGKKASRSARNEPATRQLREALAHIPPDAARVRPRLILHPPDGATIADWLDGGDRRVSPPREPTIIRAAFSARGARYRDFSSADGLVALELSVFDGAVLDG